MLEPKRNELQKLVEKYLRGEATPEERLALERYYQLFESAPEVTELLSDDQLVALGDRMKDKITSQIHSHKRPFYSNYFFRAAAIVTVLLGSVWLVRLNTSNEQILKEPIAQVQRADASVNRFLTLPDGSTVVLHKGSTLELAQGFNEESRTVYLSGEAYFDVFHNPQSPFIIRTGKLKTTVLGTAFTIKAWPNQKDITVSVSRGKVQVEDDQKLIAVLTNDKQVTYHIDSDQSDEIHIPADQSTAWIQQDMTFDDMPFGELARRLSKRYGVEIRFKNSELEQCLITGRFSGTETLDEVMRTLTLTSNTRFSEVDDEILIEGDKCY